MTSGASCSENKGKHRINTDDIFIWIKRINADDIFIWISNPGLGTHNENYLKC